MLWGDAENLEVLMYDFYFLSNIYDFYGFRLANIAVARVDRCEFKNGNLGWTFNAIAFLLIIYFY